MSNDVYDCEEHGPNTLDRRLGGPGADEICAAFDEHLRANGWQKNAGELHFFAAGVQWATERRAAQPSPAPTQLDALRTLAEGWEEDAARLRAHGHAEVFAVATLETHASAILAIIGRV